VGISEISLLPFLVALERKQAESYSWMVEVAVVAVFGSHFFSYSADLEFFSRIN
jgi:hypothetical protein